MEKVIKKIELIGLFKGLQKQMLNSLMVDRGFIPHPGSKGDASEHRWINFLRTYLPDRYKVDKAIVIDFEGKMSDQIDVVIYDGLYTPFIFNQDGHQYVPAESVYAVFEVKQDIKGNVGYAAQKVESVRRLKRTSIDMVASGKPTKARDLPEILGGILTTTNSYKRKDPLDKQLENLKGLQTLDLGCCCGTGSFYVCYEKEKPSDLDSLDTIEKKRADIERIYGSKQFKKVKYSNKDLSLFTFLLQLVSCLKTIGTVPAIDINAYLGAIGWKINENL